jgi:mono/diheme cytochrome c family protein
VLLAGGCTDNELSDAQAALSDHVDNLRPFQNANGAAASFSTTGGIDQTGEFFIAHGSNGRSCNSCHAVQDAWSLSPATLQQLFNDTGGTDPVFNPLDAKNPATNDLTTVEGRRFAYQNLLEKGVFRRGGAPRAVRDWDLIAVDDPNGFANLTRMVAWHRTSPLINLSLGTTRIHWDGGMQTGAPPTVRAGLETQATKSIPGAQQAPATTPEVVANVVDFEIALYGGQTIVNGIGDLVTNGSTGGPAQLALQERASGRFDLFDAWRDDTNEKRAQIARGQDLFNANCNGCHNARNTGSNIDDRMFNIQTASADVRTPDQTLHTFALRADPTQTIQLTDAGLGNVTGLYADLGKFKVPQLRALAARAPYFHDGRVATLDGVVRHYERFLGFAFTDQQRADLVAFLAAL